MGAETKIEWCDHSFNPWTGCQAVSPACDHCYAEAQAKRAPRTFGGWGPHAERKRTSESYWRQPLLWNKRAAKGGIRPRVTATPAPRAKDVRIPRAIRGRLPKAALLHFEWAPALFPDRPLVQRNRLANAVRLRIGSLVITRRASWLPHSARALHPHLFAQQEATRDAG